MTLGVVIPCYRQERFLPRTLAALEHALEGRDWRGVLVLSAPDGDARDALPSSRWSVLRAAGAPGTRPLSPGAARNAGFAACGGDWVLFVDADVEVERAWLERAVATATAERSLAGSWGRIEEWFIDGERVRPGVRDLYRVGDHDADARYTATLSFYRREALTRVGGYDARLQSEEPSQGRLRRPRQRREVRERVAAARAERKSQARRAQFDRGVERTEGHGQGVAFGPQPE
ncbi:MAG: glycosyltransferase family 2 protein, partial [Candidatus Eisenbacteria bacterium]|nr:glycosyltransferase family 2 protein [Candidatus Eisenbacteria bacterium]